MNRMSSDRRILGIDERAMLLLWLLRSFGDFYGRGAGIAMVAAVVRRYIDLA
jgi:hypothetical protein